MKARISSAYEFRASDYAFVRDSKIPYGSFNHRRIVWPWVAAGLALALLIAALVCK